MNKPTKKQEVADKVRSLFASNNGQVKISKKKLDYPVADTWRVVRVRLNPPLRQNYSFFVENFRKNQGKT